MLKQKVARCFYVLLLLLIITNFLFADKIDVKTARTVAYNFYLSNVQQKSDNNPIFISKEFVVSGEDQPLFYVFNFADERGFVLVSAYDICQPILGYSFAGNYKENNPAPGFDYLVNSYKEQIIKAVASNLKADKSVGFLWDAYKKGVYKQKKKTKSVEPLIKSKWGQGCYYNDSCPAVSGGPCSKAQAGCVATALAQIMRFYNFPASGSGSHSYKHSSFGILNADFENTVYNWSQMPDALSAPNPYVAQLIAHIGKSSDMNYSPTYSGAYSEKAINALFHYFHYSDKLRLLYRDGIADSSWLGMMKNELLAGRPFYYVGYQTATGQNGHAFVCDGFQDDDFFHFNFGWNGSYDGYYLVNNITPYVSYNYIQSAMFGIEPAQYRDCNGLNVYDALESNISDGSLDQPYSNNSDCYWLLGNDNTSSVYIRFYTFNTEQDKDLLYVYDGIDTTAKLLGVFSGNKLPPTLKSENGKMLLRFKTDDTISKAGWSAYYKMSFCKNLQVLTAFSDTISDCSGEYNYNNESNCKWLIKPENSKSINIKFLEFDTEKDWDFLYIYKGKDTLAPLIAKYSGIELPADINIESDVVLLHFISDYALNSKGWKLTYSACPEKPLLNKAGSVYFCKQDTVILNAKPGFSSYRWYKNDTLILNSGKNQIIVSDTGIYSVRVNKNSDCFVSSALVSFFYYPEPSFDLGKDTIICINHKILLKAPPGFKSYLWSTGNSADSLLIDYSFVDKDSLVRLSLEVKDTNGCRFKDSINIYFDDCVGLNRDEARTHRLTEDLPRLVYNNKQIIVTSENPLPAFSLIFYNIQGQRLYKKDFLPATNEITIKMEIRLKGLYFVIFNSDKLKLRKKILIY